MSNLLAVVVFDLEINICMKIPFVDGSPAGVGLTVAGCSSRKEMVTKLQEHPISNIL